VKLNLGTVDVVLVSDSTSKKCPVIQGTFEDFDFYAEKIGEVLRGEGSSVLSVSFYNRTIQDWEPILEAWKPSIQLSSHPKEGYFINLSSEQAVQMTTSTIMISTVFETYSEMQLSHSSERNSHFGSDVILLNHLGVGVEVFSSVEPGTRVPLTDEMVREDDDPENDRTGPVPSFVDVRFLGKLGEMVEPLYHVSTEETGTRVFHLLPKLSPPGQLPAEEAIQVEDGMEEQESVNGEGTWRDSDDAYPLETVEEELFENARYDPINGIWRDPFLLGDPFKWTDSTCALSDRKDRDDFELPSEDWRWLDDWRVDVEGGPSEIDSDGWEYSEFFNSFAPGSVRRALQATCYCRRRRWIRTRVRLATPPGEDRRKPWEIVCDVHVLESGQRMVELHSGFQVTLLFVLHGDR
jgi:hypothetical protein